MTALLGPPDTVMPSPQDTELAARASQVLAAKAEAELRVTLDDGTEPTLPKRPRGCCITA